MNAVRARLDSDGNHAAGLAAIFGRRIFLDIHLLDSVNRQNRGGISRNSWPVDDRQTRERIIVGQTVDDVLVILRAKCRRCSGSILRRPDKSSFRDARTEGFDNFCRSGANH